jgi:hypothetical protein
MIRLDQRRIFYAAAIPGTVVLLAIAWITYRPLSAREAALDAEIASRTAELASRGFGLTPDAIGIEAGVVEAEVETLRAIASRGRALDRAPLVMERGGQPFQLLEFEQERAAAAGRLQARAEQAKVKLEDGGLEFLGEASIGRDRPRALWAQLALAEQAIGAALASGVQSVEPLVALSPRELRANAEDPPVAEEISIALRVIGTSATVQSFIERLSLGDGAADLLRPLLLDRLVLRKEGTENQDRVSANLVVTGLLTYK